MRILSSEELVLVQKAIIRKEIAILELLAEVYDHYISHLEQYSELEFSEELKNLEEKWSYVYCDKLQQEFRKGVNKSIRSLRWKLIKSYFSLPKIVVTILLVLGLVALVNSIGPKNYLWTVIFPILILLLGLDLLIIFKARKKFKSLRSIFNFKSMGIWVVSAEASSLGLIVSLPLHFVGAFIQLPRIFEATDFFNNPLYLMLVTISSFFLILYSLTSYEAWKIKSKTALI
jgi:hypothetical protein